MGFEFPVVCASILECAWRCSLGSTLVPSLLATFVRPTHSLGFIYCDGYATEPGWLIGDRAGTANANTASFV